MRLSLPILVMTTVFLGAQAFAQFVPRPYPSTGFSSPSMCGRPGLPPCGGMGGPPPMLVCGVPGHPPCGMGYNGPPGPYPMPVCGVPGRPPCNMSPPVPYPMPACGVPGRPPCGNVAFPYPTPFCGVPGRPPCNIVQLPPPVLRPLPPPMPWNGRPLPFGFAAPPFAPPPPPPQIIWTNLAPQPPAVLNSFDTKTVYNLPSGPNQGGGFNRQQSSSQLGAGISLAVPPLPDTAQLQSCYDDSQSKDDFYSCMVEKAFPPEYRITKQCLEDNDSEPLGALVCSSNSPQLSTAYGKFKKVRDCFDQEGKDEKRIAICAGSGFLGDNERYYVSCVANNPDSYGRMAVCALGKNLNPEWQIAASCAVETGGQPYAFAVCTGGQLMAREIGKCWQHGVATDDGCFGPNNEYVKLVHNLDNEAKNAFGENSVAYQAYHWYNNNVMAPGPNHEVVKAFNTVLNDVTNGPGPNNDVIKFVNKLPQAKIGNVRVCIPWC